MLNYIYVQIKNILQDFRGHLIDRDIAYYLHCSKRKKSCLIVVKLRCKVTNRSVLHLRIKIRNAIELNNLDDLLSECISFVNPSI